MKNSKFLSFFLEANLKSLSYVEANKSMIGNTGSGIVKLNVSRIKLSNVGVAGVIKC